MGGSEACQREHKHSRFIAYCSGQLQHVGTKGHDRYCLYYLIYLISEDGQLKDVAFSRENALVKQERVKRHMEHETSSVVVLDTDNIRSKDSHHMQLRDIPVDD